MTNEPGGLPERTGPPDGDASALILCTVGGVGGATRVVGTLAAKMRDFGVLTRLVFPDPSSLDAIAAVRWLNDEGIMAESSDDLPAWYGSHGLRAMARLRRLVRTANATATYLHYGSNQIAFRDVIAVRMARRGRCVVMVHHAAPIGGWRPRLMTRIGANLAHEVVVSTPVMADLLTGIGVRPSKVTVIPLGVPPPREAPSQREARARLSLPPGAFVVAAVARLDRGKNILQLVRCVARLVRDGVDAHLVVAGVGEDSEPVAALIARTLRDRGHMLGRVATLDDVYASADVFALPSREEGFGLVFLEAAWHRVPSVAYAVGGVPYAINDGVTGVLVPLDDEAAFADQLRRLHDEPALRRSLGNAARARVAAEFSDTVMTERHLATLRVTLGDRE